MTREQPETWQSYLDRRPTREEMMQQIFESRMDRLPEDEEAVKEEEERREITARAIESLL